MKKPFILLTALALSACSSQKVSSTNGCEGVMCTDEFKMIPVKLISTAGREVSFKSYKVIELATGKEIKSNDLPANDNENTNTLIVADDGNRRNFSEKGADLQLQVTRNDGKVIKADFKIAGGKCACHVSKLQGPDQVDIDQALH